MKNKLAIVLPNLCGGGVERMRIYLAGYFIQKGYNVQFVLFQKKGELLSLVSGEAEIICLNAKKLRDGFSPLRKYISNEKPDALLAAMWPVSVIAIWAAKLSTHAPRVVVSEHNQQSSTPVYQRGLNSTIMPLTMKFSYPFADAVVGVSDGVVNDLIHLSKSDTTNLKTIYNPAAPAPETLQTITPNDDYWNSQTSFKIIGIGSLKKQKDFPNFVEAFSLVNQQTEAELLILGEGDERENLEQLIAEKGLKDRVHLPGFVKDPLQYIKSADLFVLSSAWEGFGNVIVEALACGVPVVSTDCKSGPREILADGEYGTLVPVGDAEKLAEAIVQNLNKKHDTEKLKRRAQDFSVDKIAGQYLKLLFPVTKSGLRDSGSSST